MTLTEITTAVMDIINGLGLVPFITFGAVVALAASLYKKVRR